MVPKSFVKLNIDQMSANCESVSAILKALSHPQRLMILCFLSEDEKSVGELQELTGKSQSHVSQFLARMKLEGLVDSHREGNNVHYHLKDLRVVKLIRFLEEAFCTEAPTE
jgi:ArsR family transcriptional regulator